MVCTFNAQISVTLSSSLMIFSAMQSNMWITRRITIDFLSFLFFFLPSPIFSSYPPRCAPRSCFFHLSLPHYTSLLFQLLLLHADLIPTAQPLATPPRAQGRPRSSSQIPDHCFVEGSGWGCGGSSGGKWSIAEPRQDCLWGSTGPQTTQEERAQA